MKLRKDTKFEKCLHGKIQNANESFNGKIWERVPKNASTELPNLEFGVYDAVAHFNIGIKASVLIYEKHNFAPGVYMLKGCKKQFKKGQFTKSASVSEKQTKTTNLVG